MAELTQKDWRAYFENIIGSENWVPIYRVDPLGASEFEISFKCVLIEKKATPAFLKNPSWSVDLGVGPNEDAWCNSYSQIYDGILPIAYEQGFYGLKDSLFHFTEEVTQFLNLFPAGDGSYHAFSPSGEEEEIAKIENGYWKIRKESLLRYAAARQMNLCFLVASIYESQKTVEEQNQKEDEQTLRKKNFVSYFCQRNENGATNCRSFSRFVAEKIIPCPPLEKSGVYPYEKKEYCSFIIGIDGNGDNIMASCEEDHLYSRASGENKSHLIDYLTPVFFKNSALEKYYQDSAKYKVTEGYLSCGNLWGVEIDLQEKEFTIYLGDLGRDVPYAEQLYLKSFNTPGAGRVSKQQFLRDNLCVFTKPQNSDSRFFSAKKDLEDTWRKRFGWDLFIPLEKGDEHCLSDIHTSITNTQKEFDDFVTASCKVLVDSLNESELKAHIDDQLPKDTKGIKKLEIFLKQEGIPSEETIEFLRSLYYFRDNSTAHRKNETTEERAKKLGINGKTHQEQTETILIKATTFCESIIKMIEKTAN